MELQRKSDRNAVNGEDMLEVLADDLSRYDILSAISEEEEQFLIETVQGEHFDFPIRVDNQHDQEEKENSPGPSRASEVLPSKDASDLIPRRFVSVSADECDTFLNEHVNKNTKYKTTSDLKIFRDWARENEEYRDITDIPEKELDGLLARMYLGRLRSKRINL